MQLLDRFRLIARKLLGKVHLNSMNRSTTYLAQSGFEDRLTWPHGTELPRTWPRLTSRRQT
jgi:hypothetical protein